MAEDYGRTVLSRTPLHSRHVDAGAKMADFGGWDMPIEYNGTVAEHASVREAVGIFDVSHMGKVAIFGTGASDFVNSIVANDLDRIGAGQAQYSMVCNDTGGVVDDLIVYKWGDDGVYIVPNAANAATITGIFEAAAVETITVDDQQLTHGIIAVQGPKSADVLSAVDLPTDMDYMAFAVASWRDEPITVCRSGYTGELGFELIAPNSVLGQLWDEVAGSGRGRRRRIGGPRRSRHLANRDGIPAARAGHFTVDHSGGGRYGLGCRLGQARVRWPRGSGCVSGRAVLSADYERCVPRKGPSPGHTWMF